MASTTSQQNVQAVAARATASPRLRLRLRASQRHLRMVDVAVDEDDDMGRVHKIQSIITSCHTLDQLNNCRDWLRRMKDADVVNLIDASYLLGVIGSTGEWLCRRFAAHKRTWKWSENPV